MAGRGVEVTRRFIGEDQFGAGGKSPGKRHTLLFATGEMLGIVTKAMRKTHAFKPAAGLAAGRALTRQLQRQHDVFQRSQRRQQLKRLEDEAQDLAA